MLTAQISDSEMTRAIIKHPALSEMSVCLVMFGYPQSQLPSYRKSRLAQQIVLAQLPGYTCPLTCQLAANMEIFR